MNVKNKNLVPFIGGSYDMIEQNISTQSCDNCYIELMDGVNAKHQSILKGTPGTRLWVDLDLEYTKCRGLFSSATGSLYAVFGTTLYKIDSSTEWSIISTSISGSTIGQVSFAESVFYLMLVDGVRMYAYNFADDTFQVVSYPDDAQPKQIVWLGGRMVAINAGVTDAQKNQVFYSAAAQDSTDTDHVLEWSITDGGGFFSAIQSADPIATMQVSNGYLWLFGGRSYEIHAPTFDANDPFDLIDSTTNAVGCSAPLGSTEISDVIFFFGSARAGTQQIFMSNGLSVRPISTVAIENKIAEFYSQGVPMNDVNIYSYSQAGHIFVVFNFVSANITWVYDMSTGLFHRRTSYNNQTAYKDRWKWLWCVEFDGKIITSADNGKLLELNIETYTDYNEESETMPLVMEYTGPVWWSDFDDVTIDEVYIDMQVGVGYGQPGDQSYNPQMVVESSRNGGASFRNERLYYIGKAGEYNKKIRIRKLGVSHQHVLRLRISDPVKRAIYSARLTSVTAGN